MENAEMVNPGQFLWVIDDNLCLKMIVVESIYWDVEPELEGWNVVCQGEEYYLECCYKLEHLICAN